MINSIHVLKTRATRRFDAEASIDPQQIDPQLHIHILVLNHIFQNINHK